MLDNNNNVTMNEDEYSIRTKNRLAMGMAWMMCNTCGAKIWDFDGNQDAAIPCPYMAKDPRDNRYKCKYDVKRR